MPVPGGMYQTHGPSCFDKMKMGFMIGFCVGMASGGIFGGFTALRLVIRQVFYFVHFRKCLCSMHVGTCMEHLHHVHLLPESTISFVIGYRYGARGRELVHSVGKVMLQGGGTFGTFMAIGTGIRC